MNRVISLEQLCRMLSVSVATGKNWLKLGKIIPSKIEGRKVYFNQLEKIGLNLAKSFLQKLRDERFILMKNIVKNS